MAGLGVDFGAVDEKDAEGGGGGVVPKGRYPLHIVEGDVKDNKKGTGKLFEFTAEVMDGEFKGRKIWERINVTNQSATAQKIGQAQLKALALACGIDPASLTDTDQLLYQPFWADLDVEQYKSAAGADKERNTVAKYIHAGNASEPPETKAPPAKAPVQTAPKPQPQTAPRPQPTGTAPNMPWKRSA